MSASDELEDGLLNLILLNSNYANMGDATGLRGSTTAGVLYVSLHTATLADTATQTTTESAYSSYARQSVVRSAAGWSVAAGVGDNDSVITFPTCGVTGSTVTDFMLGSDSSGTGHHFLSGPLAASLAVSSGITPSFAAGALDVTCTNFLLISNLALFTLSLITGVGHLMLA